MPVVVTLLALLVLEGILRTLGYDPLGEWVREEGRARVVRLSTFEDLRYQLVPGASGGAWNMKVTVNSHGFRDREYSPAKGDDYRIAVLGDSITFGNGVPIEEAYSEVLEASLNDRFERRVDVLNMGVGGYDVVQEVAQLEHYGLRFDPDLVILGFCTNDIGDFTANEKYLRGMERLESPVYRLRVAQFVRVSLDRVAALYTLLKGTTDEEFFEARQRYILPIDGDAELRSMMGPLDDVAFEDSDTFRLDRGLLAWWASEVHVGMLEYAFSRLARLRAEFGFEALIVVFPWLGEGEHWETVYRILEHEARKFDLPVLQLPELASAGFSSVRMVDRDRLHPNARGHQIIAGAIERHLLERGLAEKLGEPSGPTPGPGPQGP